MPDSTSALINSLTNPPNPLNQFGGTLDLANKIKDFQANQAASDAYRQSIDPETGAFDQGKFNSVMQQSPAAMWKFGEQMRSSGVGNQAQGLGTQAQTDAARGQLTMMNGVLTPFLLDAQNGIPVNPDDVKAAISNSFGLTPQMKQAAYDKLGTLQGKDAGPMLKGWAFATQSPEGQATRTMTTTQQNIEMMKWWTEQGEYPDPADPTKKKFGSRASAYADYGNSPDILNKFIVRGFGGGSPGMGGSSGAGSQSGGKGGTPGPQSSAGGTESDPRGLVPYIRQAAIARGIDPDVAVKVARSEGLEEFSGDGGQSGGAFQLHVTPGNKGGHVGDRFMADTGLDPRDPANEKATIDYALDTAAKNGWGEWNGAKRVGITGFTGIGKPPTQTASAPAAPTDTTPQPNDNGYPFPTLTPRQAAKMPPTPSGQKSAVVAPPLPPNTTNWAGGSLPMSTALPPSSTAAAVAGQPSGAWPGASPVLTAGGGAQVPAPQLDLPPVNVSAQGGGFPLGNTVTMPRDIDKQITVSRDAFNQARANYDTLSDRLTNLTQAADILRNNPNLATGTGAEDVLKLQNIAQTVLGQKLSPEATSNLAALTELNKNLERYYLSIPGSNRSDLSQTETKMANPTIQMQREALSDLLAKTIGMERLSSIVYQSFVARHGGNPAQAESDAAHFSAEMSGYRNQFDPAGFGADYMNKQQLKKYMDGLPNEAAKTKFWNSILQAEKQYNFKVQP